MISRDELQQRLIEIDRKGGLESLFYFAKFILGYDKMEQTPHGEVCAFIESIINTDRFGLDLEPRGSFKTTEFSQALTTWLLVKNPNIRILLDSAVLQNSIDNLGVVKRHLEGNEKLRYLYGDLVGGNWTNEAITIGTRTDRGLKEPSVRCASVERTQVGPHYDVIIADDLASEENSKTPEGRRQVKDHLRLLFALLEPHGILIVVGTRWNYDDLYGMIADEFPEFKKRIKCAGGEGCPHGLPLYFKQILTQEFLTAQKRRQGREIYNCQYENDPAPEDKEAKFQKTWFKSYADKDLPEVDDRYGFIVIDPGGEKKGSDEWAILCGYRSNQDIDYFHDLHRGNWRTDQAWDLLFLLASQIRPLFAVGLETTGGQKYLRESLNEQMRRRQIFLPVIDLTHAKDSKDYRILRLQPRYQAGAILHSQRMGPLEEQLRRFPKGKDDVADVAAMFVEVAFAPSKHKPKQLPPKTFDEAVWRSVLSRNGDKRPAHSMLGSEF